MSITRRGILGGLSALIASPKSFLQQRAGGFVPSAHSVLSPSTWIQGEILSTYSEELAEGRFNQPLDVLANIPFCHFFEKENIEPYENSQDTSSVCWEFGVSIYTDPSGVFTNEI